MIYLSLFDGCSSGLQKLKDLNKTVTKYYASEIDPIAIKTANKNHSGIIQLGDIEDWMNWNIEWNIEWNKIDAIIGGSPCQGLSFSGKRLNFADPRSKLFFVFRDIVNYVKTLNPKVKVFLENVTMDQQSESYITSELGVKPQRVNSSLVSAHSRDRLYWTNIEGFEYPEQHNIHLEDFFTEDAPADLFMPNKYTPNFRENVKFNVDKSIRLGGYNKEGQGQRIYSIKGKSVCLSALGGGWGAKTGLYLTNKGIRKPTIRELCILQGMPIDYFEGLDLKYSQIAKMLGNGWQLDTIELFFKHI